MQDGDFVHVQAGQTIVLDVTTPNLGGMWIQGDLIFDHSKPSGSVGLRSAYVIVTGTLQIGCKNGPVLTRFTKNTSITLVAPETYATTTGHTLTDGVHWPLIMDQNFLTEHKEAALDRGLVIVGSGEFYAFGNSSRSKTWTTLSSSVLAGDSLLPLSDPLTSAWKLNDFVVVASTDFEYADQWQGGIGGGPIGSAMRGGHAPGYGQGEEFGIVALHPTLQSIEVAPLAHSHFSGVVSASFPSGSASIEMRAEVANLTRSIVIVGEESEISRNARGGTAHRGHVILMKQGTSVPYCEVDWTEFRNLGVEGKLGRYPFHWHMLGDARRGTDRPYLRDCSIHDSLNRFVVVHRTRSVDVERNVAYDCLGTGFFLEDDDPALAETQDVLLRDNLGMKVGRPTAFSTQEGFTPPLHYQELDLVDPSVFWIQHPNQKVEGNHAAGAAGHGFYLAPNQLADGQSHTAASGSYFRNNVAHSNGQHGFYHQTRVRWNWQTGDAPAGEGLVSWKNRRYGIWWRTYGTSLLEGCQVADNKSGIYPASEGRQNAHDGSQPPTCRLTIRDALIFGETPNVGEPSLANPAEVQLGRSLPQTYWNFQRPEALASTHESEWDALNGLESYDGRNLFEDLKLAYFPGDRSLPDPNGAGSPASQIVAGITQVEYNSKFAEDPRNSIEGLQFAAPGAGQVVNPIRYRMTLPANANSMVRNTVVYDTDGSLGHGTDVYVCYDDPFFEANAAGAGTRDVSRNLLILPTAVADFAQFEVRSNLVGTGPMDVSVKDRVTGAPRGIRVGLMSGNSTKDFFFNAPLGLDADPLTGREGVYTCSFPNASAAPTEYTIKLQFAESAGLPTIIGVPLVTLDLQKGVRLNGALLTTNSPDLASLLGSAFPQDYFHDTVNSILYVKTTTVILGPGGSADVDGTRNVITINL